VLGTPQKTALKSATIPGLEPFTINAVLNHVRMLHFDDNIPDSDYWIVEFEADENDDRTGMLYNILGWLETYADDYRSALEVAEGDFQTIQGLELQGEDGFAGHLSSILDREYGADWCQAQLQLELLSEFLDMTPTQQREWWDLASTSELSPFAIIDALAASETTS